MYCYLEVSIMFELTKELLEKLKEISFEPQLVAAGPNIQYACAPCSGTCKAACRNNCSGSCKSGCTRSCRGNSR